MIDLGLRARKSVPAGRKLTIELVVRNVSDVPCVRRIDSELQEIVLLDADGDRVWGSNDCLREKSDRRRTLEPEEGVALEVEWSGRTSEPTCTRERTAPSPGVYVLRGRLDDKTTPERRIRLT
jgi:hypothetical protein